MALTEDQKVAARSALRLAARILNRPGAWGKGAMAKDRTGTSTGPSNELAAQVCLVGSAYKALALMGVNGEVKDAAVVALDKATQQLHGCSAITFNDTRATSAKQVVRVARKAAELV